MRDVRRLTLTEIQSAGRLTVTQLARLYNLKNFDTAIPVDFVHRCRAHGFNPVGQVVWSYEHSLFGRPFPLTAEAELRLTEAFPDIPIEELPEDARSPEVLRLVALVAAEERQAGTQTARWYDLVEQLAEAGKATCP